MMSEIRIHAHRDRAMESGSDRRRGLALRALEPSLRSFALSAVAALAVLGSCDSSALAESDRFRFDTEPDELVEVEVGGVVAAPMDLIRSVLLDLEGFARWYPATGDWRILERDDEQALVYGRQSLPWPVGDRDYVVRYAWHDGPDGEFVLEAASVAGIGPPPGEGAVRVPYLWTRWRIRPHADGTDVHYHYRGDPGGSLPVWLARTGWRSQTGRVIEALMAEAERRRSADGP